MSANEAVEIIDKTVEGAVEKAVEELGVKKENVNVEVIAEPGSGILGFLGNKQAKVAVSIKQSPAEYAQNLMSYFLEKLGVNGEVEVSEKDGDLYVDISGDNLGVLIGRRGQNLNSMQYLANVILHRQFGKFDGRVVVDVENYRQERETALEQLAQNMAQKVEENGREVSLEPMSPQERRIIHLALKDHPQLITYSSGEEPNRKVVIAPRS